MEELEITDKNIEAQEIDSALIFDEPVYTLKDGLDLKNLIGGATFELDLESESDFPKGKTYFNDEELLNNLNIEDTGGNDTDDDLEPFESLKKKMTLIGDGIYKRVKVPGHGIVVPDKSFVTIHYNNYVEYSEEPFDSTRLRNIPFKFNLNTGAVIPGLDVGVSTMQTGEVAQILIPPELAFGKMGVPPRIPPNATVLCEVEMVSFVDSADLADYNYMTPEERKEVNFAKKLNACKTKHKIGNNFYQEKMYGKAIDQYRWAVNTLENATLRDEEEEKQQQGLLSKLHLNLSQCYLLQSKPRLAKLHARRALDIVPSNTKAHFRLGKALRMEGEFQMSGRHLRKALRNEPNSAEILEELTRVDRLKKQSDEMERSLYQRMLGQKTVPTPATEANALCEPAADFRNKIEEFLVNFKNDDSLVELPFALGFSPSDIACVKEVAREMGFEVEEVKQGPDNIVRVLKRKRQDDNK